MFARDNLRTAWNVCTIVGVLRGTVACAVGLLLAGACGGGTGTVETEGIKVVASFYPLAYIAEQVGGKQVLVSNLTPTGAEPHELELTPKQLGEISDADLVIVMGKGFQPAVEAAAANSGTTTLSVLDLFGQENESDPHVWLDPVSMQIIVAAVEDALVLVDVSDALTVHAAAEQVTKELSALDVEHATALNVCERRDMFTAHDSFGWLAQRYRLSAHGVASINPNAEPGPERLVELAKLARSTGATTIFSEALLSAEVAEALANEAGDLSVAILNPLEGLSETEVERGDDYFDIMRTNLRQLRVALGCE